MTRKDYYIIAHALNMAKTNSEEWREAVSYMANALKADNGRFDFKRFYEACGYEI